MERALAVTEELNRARDLINTPPNDLDPEAFAAVAQTAAKEHGIKVEVLDEKALEKGGYGGILGVGAGSAAGPRLVKLSYTNAKASKHLAFVGKGITYDSGGISLKPAGHNETMKCDMSGAAAVFAAVVAAARLGLEVNVTGWLALAENMPSGSATRPGDVLRMYSGKTVEVLNTDAEGRLVLADALWAASAEKPDAIVDVATLTGAMVLALGSRTFGVMANDDAFRAAIVDAAEEVGEPSWPMPLPEHLRKGMDSPPPTSRTWVSGWVADSSRGCSCASSWVRGSPGRTSTSRGPRSTRAGRSATRPRAGRGPRCGRSCGLRS